MSVTKNKCVRCDKCGRISNHPLGRYTRPDKSTGYICSQGRDCSHDFCDECEDEFCYLCEKSHDPQTS